jgi:LmbE family N-acetylglucosaminyl deacetylase
MAIPVAAQAQTLVVAPHPDDDIIIASGVIQRALARGEQVWVVYVTNGDRAGISVGTQRQGEAVTAQGILGQPEERLIFLGYPDGWVFDIRDRWRYPWDYTDADQPLVTPNGISATYASRGLGHTDYHSYRFGVPGPYRWETMIGDMADLLVNLRPTHIFTTSQWDTHLDHEATFFLVQSGVLQAIETVPGYNPTIHKTTVWPGDTSWPLAADPTTPFTEIPKPAFTNRWGANPLTWPQRESLDTPLAMQSTFFPGNPKFNAISAHASQGGMDEYIGRWLHQDEFFWTEQFAGTNLPPVPNAGVRQQVNEGVDVTLDASGSFDPDLTPLTYLWRQVAGPAVTLSDPAAAQPVFFSPVGLAANVTLAFELVVSDGALTSVADAVSVVVLSSTPPPTYGPNLAPTATIAASSQRTATGQTASKVADGSPLGYPVDPTHEWSTSGQGVGAWLTMTWAEAVSVSKIVLYDRPNTSDQLTAGIITFSDGTTLPVGPLVNIGSAVEYVFPGRTITSLRLDVTGVSSGTGNVGLAEFEVFEVGGINRPPIANAGPNQTVASLAQVTLNGTASRDPNNDPLSFMWSQIAGTAVSLSNPAAASPTFSAPEATPGAQLLRFQLVVADAEFSSAPDQVDILVPGTANSLPVASAGPDQTVSADSTVTLDGSATDLDGQPLTYLWTQIAGTAVALSDATAARPTFILPVTAIDEILTFQLVAHDGVAPSAPDTVDIRVIALPSAAANIAPAATVTASSQRAPLQAAIKAVDGFTDGYPTNSGHEWATQNQLAGAWLQLDWPVGHVLNRVRLYDRPNLDDQVTSATLTFSDGSFINLGPLDNAGAATDVPFAPRRVRWVRFTVNTVRQGSVNIGLAEIMTFEVEGAGEDQPPVAIAGANQDALGGASVQLDGSASNDPDGSALTFAWTQLSGPAVTLNGDTTPMPSFTAPLSTRVAQVLRFQLTVNDGNLTSGDIVDVTVVALPNARPVAVLGPPQTVDGGATVQLDGSASFDSDNDPLITSGHSSRGRQLCSRMPPPRSPASSLRQRRPRPSS